MVLEKKGYKEIQRENVKGSHKWRLDYTEMNRGSFDRQSVRELETTKNNTQKDLEFIVSRF